MRNAFAAGLAFILCLCMPMASMAQQGHPLAGIWLGNWTAGGNATDIVLELTWTNTTLSGNINPGFPDEATIDAGTLNPDNWSVHIEAASKDEAGKPVRVVIDGKIDNLGSAKRSMSGTWKRGATSGNFKLTRE